MAFESALNDVVGGATGAIDWYNTVSGLLRGRPWYNPLDYGVTAAQWDAGTADAAAATQGAIDDAASQGGGLVLMPPGAPRWDTPVTLDEADGAGYQAVSLLGPGSPALVIDVNHNGTGLFFGTSRGVADSLTAPKSMGNLRGFKLDGPGRGTAGSIGVHCKEASYYSMSDVFCNGTETAFYFDTGNSFATGGYHEHLRTLQCKFGYILNDKGEGGTTLGEYTDGTFIRCYCNPGSGGFSGSIGWWLARVTTSCFVHCGGEAFDYIWQLGIDGAGGTTGRNTLIAPRAETGIVMEGRISDGIDNWIFGGNVGWVDETNSQQNVIVGSKFSVAGDAEAANNQPRLVRPITAAALPTANSDRRGQIFYRPGNAGTKDQVVMCMKSATDTYSWVDLSL